jgi:hypothetical protein
MPASFEDTYVIGRCTVSSAAITGGRECGEMLPVGVDPVRSVLPEGLVYLFDPHYLLLGPLMVWGLT